MTTQATYIDGRHQLLVAARRYRSYANREPAKAAHFQAHRKLVQRQLAALRRATRVPTWLGAARPLHGEAA